ncbi:DUF6415 family natural product biosynthesis protein [Streptomyces sp. NPDC056527]|uniref:DUF6415 family natural product biosynthesis protein n=1 Tax=Streptomyces sp. NPDC056527 TaxID=3345853 RepID=UPI0036B57D3B
MKQGSVFHDPTGTAGDDIPLDRARIENLAQAALSWREGQCGTPPPAELDRIALQLTGHIRLLITEVGTVCGRLPMDHQAAVLGRAACHEAVRRLTVPRRRSRALDHVESRARLVAALYRALDRAQRAVLDCMAVTT